jgi:hypothetical protein
MGGGKGGADGVHNAQHAQGASARVHGVVGGVGERQWSSFAIPSVYCAVDDDEEDDEDGVLGRLLRRCWRYGMPRCTAR